MMAVAVGRNLSTGTPPPRNITSSTLPELEDDDEDGDEDDIGDEKEEATGTGDIDVAKR
jgi:hypothetical protein